MLTSYLPITGSSWRHKMHHYYVWLSQFISCIVPRPGRERLCCWLKTQLVMMTMKGNKFPSLKATQGTPPRENNRGSRVEYGNQLCAQYGYRSWIQRENNLIQDLPISIDRDQLEAGISTKSHYKERIHLSKYKWITRIRVPEMVSPSVCLVRKIRQILTVSWLITINSRNLKSWIMGGALNAMRYWLLLNFWFWQLEINLQKTQTPRWLKSTRFTKLLCPSRPSRATSQD